MHNCETSLLGAEDSCIQIFLISGVPGVGKTTLSYELLKQNNQTTTSNFPCNFNFAVSNMNRFNQGIYHG